MNWLALIMFIVGLIGGAVLAGFVMKRELKKNPPISEEMIAAMLKGSGQTATPKRVKQITKQMKEASRK